MPPRAGLCLLVRDDAQCQAGRDVILFLVVGVVRSCSVERIASRAAVTQPSPISGRWSRSTASFMPRRFRIWKATNSQSMNPCLWPLQSRSSHS
ncbi:hypothetical protein BS330_13015 [Amycolatopsis keratiniphila subsp. nogabecina]|nr:hypothetical protein BS330_13015 [Amycolatopsis keratiniphila subsp. nogabecina]